jgi:hypothetical protein
MILRIGALSLSPTTLVAFYFKMACVRPPTVIIVRHGAIFPRNDAIVLRNGASFLRVDAILLRNGTLFRRVHAIFLRNGTMIPRDGTILLPNNTKKIYPGKFKPPCSGLWYGTS